MSAAEKKALADEILRLRVEGKTLKEIGAAVGLTADVVNHRLAVIRKKGANIPRMKSGPRATKSEPIESYSMPIPNPTNIQCKYTGCKSKSCYTWASVPLCYQHYGAIKDETDFYYAGAKKVKRQWDRLEYMKIAHMIPWAVLKGRH